MKVYCSQSNHNQTNWFGPVLPTNKNGCTFKKKKNGCDWTIMGYGSKIIECEKTNRFIL